MAIALPQINITSKNGNASSSRSGWSDDLKQKETDMNKAYQDFCGAHGIDTSKLTVHISSDGKPLPASFDSETVKNFNAALRQDPVGAQKIKDASDEYLKTYKEGLSSSSGIVGAELQWTTQDGEELKINGDNTPSANQTQTQAQANGSAKDETDDVVKKIEDAAAVAKEAESSGNGLTAEQISSAIAADAMMHRSWDPRLMRFDAFFIQDEQYEAIIPFSSDTIASAFSDQTYNLEKGPLAAMKEKSSSHMAGYGVGHVDIGNPPSEGDPTAESSAASEDGNKNTNSEAGMFSQSTKIIASKTTEFKYDGNNYGPRSLMNPYSITKLMGGISGVVPGESAINYMYDIRDRRRFYDLTVDQGKNDPITISNPSTTNIIRWSNQDKWGRTPYSYQDFVFNKWFGLIPNNRLITFRRYIYPTYDNLNFEAMYGKIETTVKDADGQNTKETKINPKHPAGEGIVAPVASVVSYFGGETGNQLSSFLNFTTGTKWREIQSKIHDVSGNEGTDPQMEIDKMFDGSGFGGSDNSIMTGFLSNLSTVSSKIMSFGKFALASNGPVGQSEELMMHTFNAQSDPYGSGGLFENRLLGPINRVDTVKARDIGIEFEQSFQLKVSYVGKAIGGINPKAALLDCLGNAMEMCSPSAVFWGGGHRFMIEPHTYPFHDGGWRGNFMQAIYDGKFFGNGGAISIVGSGIKKFMTNDNGEIDLGKLTASIGGGIGSIMGAISAGLSALGSSIGISGIGDVLNAASSLVSGAGTKLGGEESISKGAKMFQNLSNNASAMWHDKCLQQTTFPQIKSMGALLIGEPVGEWHLTVGNPLNPIMVCGNLVCSKMQVEWDEELGPDDFPNGFTVTYTIEHGMARDKDAIQSMFNRGNGRFYKLPDYMKLSSDMESHVDHYTGGDGHVGHFSYMNANTIGDLAKAQGTPTSGYNTMVIQGGTPLANHGNPDTTLITKFTPTNTNASRTLKDIRNTAFLTTATNIPVIRSLAAIRKHIE